MGKNSRYWAEIKAGYRPPEDFRGCKSADGGLETELQVGDRVRTFRGNRGEGVVGIVLRIEVISTKNIKVLVDQDGETFWCARSFVVFEPDPDAITARKNAIREQWTRFEGGLRSKWNERKAYEIPCGVTPLY